MDTSKPALTEVRSRRHWAIEEKRKIAAETFLPGASVARVAQNYALNANQLFLWRRLYRAGRLGQSSVAKLLPVAVSDERPLEALKVLDAAMPSSVGSIEIKLAKGSLSLTGRVDLVVLRTALECLLG